MSGEKIRVFLADDHAIFREGLMALLAKDPSIIVVGECGEGLKILEETQKTQPDVIVLDITMPGLNGLDLCRELTQKVKQVEVLMLTMHSNEQCVIDALENGASGYLLKDTAAKQFGEAIHAVARGELYLGMGISNSVLRRINRSEDDPYKKLTTRERQVLQLIAEGMTNRQIASMLHISSKTVDTHRNRLMQKLGIHNQTELVKYAIRRGIVILK